MTPYADGLEHVRDMLRDMRDAALDASDRVEADGGTVRESHVGVPLVLLDLMILQLDGAKTYRDTLRRHYRSTLRISLVLSAIGLGLGMIAVAISVWAWLT
jgi:hypothetical protein